MWTAQNRGRHDCSRLHYPSDLTDEEWAHGAAHILLAKRGGNRRHVDVREVMNGILCVLSTGRRQERRLGHRSRQAQRGTHSYCANSAIAHDVSGQTLSQPL